MDNNFNFNQDLNNKDDSFFQEVKPVDKPVQQNGYQNLNNPQPSENSLKDKLINTAKIALAVTVSATCVYFFLTAPAYYEKVKYYFSKKTPQQELATTSQTITLPAVQNNPSTSNSSPTNTSTSQLTLADLSNDTLIIPKIDIKAPIIWNSPTDEESMQANLQNGVVQYGNTALPGTGKGPIFITGHSSYYWWDRGLYKTVFANLDQLSSGDEIALAYNDIVYIYKVTETKVVDPSNVEVLDPVNKPVLTLMTCVPVGTNLRRLIVNAEQISPSVNGSTTTSTIQSSSNASTKNEESVESSSEDSHFEYQLLPDVR